MNVSVVSVPVAFGSSILGQPALPEAPRWVELPWLLRQALSRIHATHGENMSAASGSQGDAAETPAPLELAALDAADIQASLRGDNQAYARLVRRYQGPVSAYMRRFTRYQTPWEELVHNVFVDAYFGLSG